MNQHLVGSIHGMSSTKITHPDPITKMAAIVNCCLWLAHLLTIVFSDTAWPNEQIQVLYKDCSFRPYQLTNLCRHIFFLVGRFKKIFSYETACPNKAIFYRKHLLKVLYKISSFHSGWTKLIS